MNRICNYVAGWKRGGIVKRFRCQFYICCNTLFPGPFKVDLYPHNIADINKQFPSVSPGGRWSPQDCTPSERIAIIVPYRDRAEDLILFLNNLHKFLQEQRLQYSVYLVEQVRVKRRRGSRRKEEEEEEEM